MALLEATDVINFVVVVFDLVFVVVDIVIDVVSVVCVCVFVCFGGLGWCDQSYSCQTQLQLR